jgi:hypothetical protein
MSWQNISDVTDFADTVSADIFNQLVDNTEYLKAEHETLVSRVDVLSGLGGFAFASMFAKITKSGSGVQVPSFRIPLTTMTAILESAATLTVSDLDTGTAFTFGADHYIWAGEPSSGTVPVLKISLSPTTPAGMTNPRIIGGFHYGKIRNSFTASDVADGIVEGSVWDLENMPECYLLGLADPSTYQLGGMSRIAPGHRTWIDIYLASDGGGTLPRKKAYSKINQLPLTGTESLNGYDFMIRAANVGKRLAFYDEWTVGALGSPQGLDGSNLNGWTKTSNTARVKAAATLAADADANYILGYNTSFAGLRDCVGNVWEWLASNGGAAGSGWTNDINTGELAGNGFGQRYGSPYQLLAGGGWDNGVFAGSRAVNVNYLAAYVTSSVGSRFACDSL